MNVSTALLLAAACVPPIAGRAHPTARETGCAAGWGMISMPLVRPGARFAAVAGGDLHSLAVTADGTVVAWGYDSSGQCNVPAGLAGVVALAGGFEHSLALRSDGTVVAWGAGEPDNPTDPFGFGQSAVPPGLGGIVAIAAGDWQSVALFAPPSLAAPVLLPNGSAQLTLSGSARMAYTIQASSDLVNWTPLASFVATNAAKGLFDPAATNLSRRFYRAMMP